MYIDPGTGSMFIQAIIAAIPVIGATLVAFRNKLLRSKGGSKSKPEAEPQDEGDRMG